MSDYVDFQQRTVPAWLAGARGLAWALVLGTMKQSLVEAAKASVKARFRRLAPPDALLEIAADRGMDPAPVETQGSLRLRVAQAWEQWEMAGTKDGMFRVFELDGLVNTIVLDKSDDPSLEWWQFTVRVSPPFPWPGSTVDDVPQEWIDRLVRLIRKWKPTHTECKRLTISCSSETWAQHHARRGTWGHVPREPWGRRRIVIDNIR